MNRFRADDKRKKERSGSGTQLEICGARRRHAPGEGNRGEEKEKEEDEVGVGWDRCSGNLLFSHESHRLRLREMKRFQKRAESRAVVPSGTRVKMRERKEVNRTVHFVEVKLVIVTVDLIIKGKKKIQKFCQEMMIASNQLPNIPLFYRNIPWKSAPVLVAAPPIPNPHTPTQNSARVA